MPIHPLAGAPAPREALINVPRLVSAYYTHTPDPAAPDERVAFGTSGHRGVSTQARFNEHHIWAITQAVCEQRAAAGVDGPLFIGMDTHALSEPARSSALEVLAAHEVEVRVQTGGGYTPTPVISHAILTYNEGRRAGLADGIVITPSHNPPDNGGFKYNPPHGGPAGSDETRAIEARANALLAAGPDALRRVPLARALRASTTRAHDYITPYVDDLEAVVDMTAIRSAGVRIGVDPMGGAGVAYWGPIAERYGLDLTVVNDRVDPTFSFMTLDHDGQLRMDCSSRYAMASLIALRDRFDLAIGNDPDFDRHGVVTPDGLMDPNHYLAVAIDHLFTTRSAWGQALAVGKTLVSSALIDRVVARLRRRLYEVPVGFKWFVDGLASGALGFGGEESAGASFLRRDGAAWTTDKDGFILGLLAAEVQAITGESPSERYRALTAVLGEPVYARVDVAATPPQKARLAALTPGDLNATSLAGDPITGTLTHAPGNGAPIGGLKVTTDQGWFAARPSGTEDVYKIYAESFRGPDHLARIQDEARALVSAVLEA